MTYFCHRGWSASRTLPRLCSTPHGVPGLAEAVVVALVVLDAPRLGQEPVPPVDEAAPERARGELEPVEARAHDLVLRELVVAAVADVVAEHRPARVDPRRHRDHRHRVGRRPQRRERDDAARVGPHHELAQVRRVGRALARLELLAERADLVAEAREVHLLDPRVVRREPPSSRFATAALPCPWLVCEGSGRSGAPVRARAAHKATHGRRARRGERPARADSRRRARAFGDATCASGAGFSRTCPSLGLDKVCASSRRTHVACGKRRKFTHPRRQLPLGRSGVFISGARALEYASMATRSLSAHRGAPAP